MGRLIALPERVAARARRHGDEGAAWVRRLPDIVAELETRWGIRIGETVRGGTAAYVARAVTAGGEDVVVKIGMPPQIDGELAFVRAVECYTLAGGKGCARLLAHDGEHSALLIESLGPNLDSLKVPPRRELEIIAATVQAMWVPVPEQTTLQTAPEKVDGLVSFMASAWEALGQPCAERTIKVVRSFAAERAAAFDRRTAVLVHGDAHRWNTLQAGDDVFKLVDPEGMISEPAHDLGIPMREIRERELPGDALAVGHDYARLLSACVGVDAWAIWQWGLIERVSTGLLLMQIGYPEGPEMLRIADRWSESPEFHLSASFDVEMLRDRAAPPHRPANLAPGAADSRPPQQDVAARPRLPETHDRGGGQPVAPTGDGRPRVFVSSTVRDLGDLRSAVKYWLEEQGFFALISESADFPHALDREAAHAALSVIDACDYYVLLIGTRRGSMFPDGDVSVTRAEFRHAREIRHAGGRLQMLCLARNELVAAARLGKPSDVEDAEWAEVLAFLEEVKTSSGPDEPNWVQPFGTFREVVDALTATLRISGPLRRRALEANLMHEIVENVKRGLTKGGRPLPTAYFLPDLAVSGQTVLQPLTIPSDRVARTVMFRLFTISAGRMRSALEAAINSGEFLDYDSSKGGFRVGPVQDALLSLRTELTQLDHLLETMGSNKTVEEDFGRLVEAGKRKTSAQILGFTAGLLKAAQAALLNSMSLGRALYRFFEGADRTLRAPDLLPAQLSDAEAERVKQEAVSDAEAEAWIRA